MVAPRTASDTESGTAIGAPMRDALIAETLRVRGTVQGVGFRPHVWRIAHELAIAGSVINDEQGVLIEALGPRATLDRLVHRVRDEAPPLARIETIERCACLRSAPWPAGFEIGASRVGGVAAAADRSAAVLAGFFGTFIGIGLNQCGLAWATSTGAVTTINSLAPVWLIPLSAAFLGERHGIRAWLSTLLALGGVALLAS